MDPDPRRGQHPRPAARADPAAGHRQGTARGGGEGTRAFIAALPGGAGVAAGRVLGAGAPPVRHRQRPVMTQPSAESALPGTALPEAASPAAASTAAASTAAPPSEAALFEVVSGDATAEEIAALTAVLAALAAAGRRNQVPTRPTAVSGWADRSRLLRSPLAPAPPRWRGAARPGAN